MVTYASILYFKYCEKFSEGCFLAQRCAIIIIAGGLRQPDFIMDGRDFVSGSIGSKLRALRKNRQFSQRYVAERVGMKRSTVSNYEIDRRLPSLTDLKRLADFYGVGLDYFDLAAANDVHDVLARARDVFTSSQVSQDAKDELYKEIVMLYLKLKK